MKFHESNGTDYYDSFISSGSKRDGELLKKIRDVIDLFEKNEGDFRTPEGRETLSIIIAEEVEEHYSDIFE